MVIRVLGLGNDLLADDRFGVEVVRRLRARLPEHVETASSIASGFALLDDVLGADRLIVVDTLSSEQAAPGTVSEIRSSQMAPIAEGASPHYVGLFETIRLGQALGLPVPTDVTILAVHARDCLTVGGEMSAAVSAAIPHVMQMVEEQVGAWDE